MHRNASVDPHNFALVPRADIPRSKFVIQSALKTTFDAAYLVPIYVDEVLPGDAFNLRMTAFCRLATPTTPVMDNLHLETFWFFVPNRLVWDNWEKFQGEQKTTRFNLLHHPTTSVSCRRVRETVTARLSWTAHNRASYRRTYS